MTTIPHRCRNLFLAAALLAGLVFPRPALSGFAPPPPVSTPGASTLSAITHLSRWFVSPQPGGGPSLANEFASLLPAIGGIQSVFPNAAGGSNMDALLAGFVGKGHVDRVSAAYERLRKSGLRLNELEGLRWENRDEYAIFRNEIKKIKETYDWQIRLYSNEFVWFRALEYDQLENFDKRTRLLNIMTTVKRWDIYDVLEKLRWLINIGREDMVGGLVNVISGGLGSRPLESVQSIFNSLMNIPLSPGSVANKHWEQRFWYAKSLYLRIQRAWAIAQINERERRVRDPYVQKWEAMWQEAKDENRARESELSTAVRELMTAMRLRAFVGWNLTSGAPVTSAARFDGSSRGIERFREESEVELAALVQEIEEISVTQAETQKRNLETASFEDKARIQMEELRQLNQRRLETMRLSDRLRDQIAAATARGDEATAAQFKAQLDAELASSAEIFELTPEEQTEIQRRGEMRYEIVSKIVARATASATHISESINHRRIIHESLASLSEKQKIDIFGGIDFLESAHWIRETEKSTRQALNDLAFVTAVQFEVNRLRSDPNFGPEERGIVDDFMALMRERRSGAEAQLASDEFLVNAGIGIDVVTTVSGTKFANTGVRWLISRMVGKELAEQTAKAVSRTAAEKLAYVLTEKSLLSFAGDGARALTRRHIMNEITKVYGREAADTMGREMAEQLDKVLRTDVGEKAIKKIKELLAKMGLGSGQRNLGREVAEALASAAERKLAPDDAAALRVAEVAPSGGAAVPDSGSGTAVLDPFYASARKNEPVQSGLQFEFVGRNGKVDEIPLGEKLGEGSFHEVFAIGNTDLVARIQLPEYLSNMTQKEMQSAIKQDKFGRSVFTDVKIDTDVVNVVKKFDEGSIAGRRVEIVQNLTPANKAMAKSGGIMNREQAIAFDKAVKELNDKGYAWLDAKPDNFAFVRRPDGKLQVVLIDTGGIVPMKGNPATAAKNARALQMEINNPSEKYMSLLETTKKAHKSIKGQVQSDQVKLILEKHGENINVSLMDLDDVRALQFNPKGVANQPLAQELFRTASAGSQVADAVAGGRRAGFDVEAAGTWARILAQVGSGDEPPANVGATSQPSAQRTRPKRDPVQAANVAQVALRLAKLYFAVNRDPSPNATKAIVERADRTAARLVGIGHRGTSAVVAAAMEAKLPASVLVDPPLSMGREHVAESIGTYLDIKRNHRARQLHGPNATSQKDPRAEALFVVKYMWNQAPPSAWQGAYGKSESEVRQQMF